MGKTEDRYTFKNSEDVLMNIVSECHFSSHIEKLTSGNIVHTRKKKNTT